VLRGLSVLAEKLLDGLEVCIFYRERVHEYREIIFNEGIGRMRAESSHLQHPTLLARLLAGYALMSGLQGEPDVARRVFDEADALLGESHATPRAWALIAVARGKLFGQRQMTLGWPLEQIEANQERAQRILEAASDEWNTAWNEFILSRVQFSLGKPHAAMQSAERSLARFEKMGDRLAQRLPHIALGFIALRQDQWDVAVAHYGTALAIAEEFEHALPIAFSHRYLCEVAWLSRRYSDARRHAESAVAIFKQRQHPEQYAVLALLERIAETERTRARVPAAP
jgi:tetratricopeptide (TPR) repeat protein